jgi:acetyl-CoA carboxylase carboxyltransferase component
MLNNKYDEYPGPERVFVECLDALNLAMRDSLADTTLPVGNNHIFINVLPVVTQSPEYVEQVIKILAKRYADRLRRLRVSQVEFRVVLSAPNGTIVPVRLISANPTGYVLRVDTYIEQRDARDERRGLIFTAFAPSTLASQRSWRSFGGSGGDGYAGAAGAGYLASLGLSSIPSPPPAARGGGGAAAASGDGDDRGGDAADLDGKPVSEPYPLVSPFESQRAGAQAMSDTVFVYDFIALFTRALEIEWSRYEKSRGSTAGGRSRPRRVLYAKELVLRVKGSKEEAAEEVGGAGGGSAGGDGAQEPGAVAGSACGAPPATSPKPMLRRAMSAYGDQFSNEFGGVAKSTSPLHGGGAFAAGGGVALPASGSVGALAPAGGGGGSLPPPAAPRSLDDYELVEVARPPGGNSADNCGMVAWRVTMFTPQYGESVGGRDVVLVANDITHRAGSFGTREDRLFELVSQYARKAGIPRVYLAANSGARIGLADEVRKLFRAAWRDPAEPAKGYDYLYLTPPDYDKLCGAGMAAAAGDGGGGGGGSAGWLPTGGGDSAGGLPTVHEAPSLATSASSTFADSGSTREAHGGCAPGAATDGGAEAAPVVKAERRVLPCGEVRFVLTDVIGREGDLGVECLRGSGTIAGETARAYNTSFTLTYVTGRSVGIGAYLVRLGHRTIQKATSAPIILTGFEALNKLMGKEVYSSNEQLGGPKIMFHNGVSHELVENDFEGVLSILRWLAFVPKVKGAPLPTMEVPRGEDVDRDVLFEPPAQPFDPRLLLTGTFSAGAPPAVGVNGGGGGALPPPEGAWIPGLFDRDSFRECMGGWAKSVVTGRARLGGIPIGVIVPELRTTTAVSPADPAAPTSQEVSTPQAGQVWFPDSAFKTSQAIRDFTGEDLPIMILANWRGFSGGARDMFDEVLKFGSTIVDALVAASTPVFVYIPPRGELRGGAWVVVDPTINPAVMEMYCDPSGRGGVLEPSGIVAIKFRGKDLADTASRLDPALAALEAAARAAPPGTEAAATAKRAAAARA